MSPDTARMPDLKTFPVPQILGRIVAGKPVPGVTGHTLPVINPATEGQISTLVEDDAAGVDAAVRAARKAFDEGPWPHLDLAARKKIMRDIRDILIANAEELAYLDCLDTGVPLWDIRGRKMGRVAENFEFFMEVAGTAAGETYQQNSAVLTFVTREPVGVAAIIAPWNSPMSLASMQIAPCIAFGNTCVVKPSEHTPVSLFRMIELMNQAGLPPGVVNLVNGRGPVTGSALVAHPGVDLVKFIGGTETGRAIMTGAATGLKKVGLELGGKSANIIFADADPEDALTGALLGIYSNNGQQCLAGSRILVQRPIAEDFMARFAARANAIKVGDPLAPDTEMGPLAFKQHFERVLSFADTARAEGAKIVAGGVRHPDFSKGYYIKPTAVLAPSNDLKVCREEIFGPFASFIVFDTLDDAIRIANDTKFGLVAYAWSRDVRNLMQVSRRVRAGTIWANTPLTREVRAPFGGYKESGIGRDGLHASLEFYTESKTTTLPWDRAPLRPIGTGKMPG
ncbi:MAG: aldehyde dehydrogenase [Rhodospirillaceae bacterium]|nr:aldehyde dehydrogenase [Rhodospirillaceae bacterium]